MKITDRFVGDHKTFRKLMKELEALPDEIRTEGESRRLVRLVELFVDHLVVHAWGEDHFYYPRFAAASAPNAVLIVRLESEHAAIDASAQALESEARKPGGGGWRPAYETFKARLSRHMAEEEETLFPASEESLGADALEIISAEIERRRGEAPPIRRHQAF